MSGSYSVRPGHLYGIGLGPDDAGLITLHGADIIRTADVVAYHTGTHGRSTARSVAAELIDARDDAAVEEQLQYPVTTGRPADYREQLVGFYAEATAHLHRHLAEGRGVAVLLLGNPMLCSLYQHLHHALSEDFPTEIVPEVASITAAAAEVNQPFGEATEIVSVVPVTANSERIATVLDASDCVIIMKLGKGVEKVRTASQTAGVLEHAYVVERATMNEHTSYPLVDTNPEKVPYFVAAIVSSTVYDTERSVFGASELANDTATGAATATVTESATPAVGEVVIVSLGPGAEHWTTPEVTEELARATDLVGYSTYVNRVPEHIEQRYHLSDNRVEAERTTMALDITEHGGHVAVVSSGDPGVFAMAAAMLEVADDDTLRNIPARVMSGMTAAQAVASRVGAPLGHSFAVLSLSDRLEPWEVIVERVRAVAGADMASAVYNPTSRSRGWQVRELHALAMEYREPTVPVIVARAIDSERESVTVTTLAESDPGVIDIRTMVIIGSLPTKAYRAGKTTRVYTARHYDEGGASGTGELLP